MEQQSGYNKQAKQLWNWVYWCIINSVGEKLAELTHS